VKLCAHAAWAFSLQQYNDMMEQTVDKNKRLSKSLLAFSLKRQNQRYIIAGNSADILHKTSKTN